jgi:DUF1680 family protein
MSNNAHVSINETGIDISQETSYPWNGQVNIEVNPAKESSFTIKLRIPGWARNEVTPGNLYSFTNEDSAKVVLKINGKVESYAINKGYIDITKAWNKGDKVELQILVSARRVIANENVKDDRDKVSFEYGPIVFCAEEIDNNEQLLEIALPEKINLKIEKQIILSNQVNVIKVSRIANKNKDRKDENELSLVPYYLWSNRGVGKMRVWFPVK